MITPQIRRNFLRYGVDNARTNVTPVCYNLALKVIETIDDIHILNFSYVMDRDESGLILAGTHYLSVVENMMVLNCYFGSDFHHNSKAIFTYLDSINNDLLLLTTELL